MRVKVTVSGCGEASFEGSPREVLERVDALVVEWKVRCHGQAKG